MSRARGVVRGTILRPESDVFRQGLIACVVFMTLVFVVLYFITVPAGPWLAVLVTQLFATILVTLAATGFLRAQIQVDAAGVAERGFFGLVGRVPIERIGSIVLANTFDGSMAETRPQLFVCDAQGRQLIRMRGQYWSRDSMDAVISTLEVPVTTLPDPISTSELGSEHPGLLYWFERHPVIAALVFSVAIVGVGLAFYALLRLTGLMP